MCYNSLLNANEIQSDCYLPTYIEPDEERKIEKADDSSTDSWILDGNMKYRGWGEN